MSTNLDVTVFMSVYWSPETFKEKKLSTLPLKSMGVDLKRLKICLGGCTKEL